MKVKTLQHIGFALSVGTLGVLAFNVEPAKSYGLDATCHYSSPTDYKEFKCTWLPHYNGDEVHHNGEQLLIIKHRTLTGEKQLCMKQIPCFNLSYVISTDTSTAVEWRDNKGRVFNFMVIPNWMGY